MAEDAHVRINRVHGASVISKAEAALAISAPYEKTQGTSSGLFH